MKFRTTILLLLLVAGLAAFIWLWENKQPATAERQRLEVRPFVFDPKNVDKIEIAARDGTIQLHRWEDGVWYLAKPMEDRAGDEMVQQLITGLATLTWSAELKRSDMKKEDFKRTGLGNGAVEVVLKGGGRVLARCFFGTAAPVDDTIYVSADEKSEVFHLARTAAQPLITKSADEWRDNRLTRMRLEHVGRFSITAGSGSMEFSRKPGQPWQIVKPIQTRASDERVNGVIQTLLKLQVKPNGNHLPPAATGSDALPPMKVVLDPGSDHDPVELTFQPPSGPEGEILVEASNRLGTFVAPAMIADYWKLQPNHLRDQNLAKVVPGSVTSIRIRSSTHPEVKLDRLEKGWVLERFGKKESANEQRIQRLLVGLNAAQVLDFLNDAATNLEPYGLDKPGLTLEWSTSDPIPGSQSRVEKTMLLDFGLSTEKQTCARYRDEPSIFRVSPEMVNTLLPTDGVKWRGTRIIDANQFSVRRIIIAEGVKPPVVLHYSPFDATWTATMAERDITPTLDKAAANALLNKLSTFAVSDWSSDRTAAIQALKNPTLTVQVVLVPVNVTNAQPEALTLTFAPTAPGVSTAIYHGRLNDDPDTFVISRDLYQELSRSLLLR